MSDPEKDSLFFVFEEMWEVLDDLLLLSKEKQASVVAGDVPRLESILLREQDLVYRLGSLDARREEIQEKQPLSREKYKQHYDTLKKKVFSLKAINEENQDLIGRSLSIVQKELSILQPEENYTKEGRKAPRVFDKKA